MKLAVGIAVRYFLASARERIADLHIRRSAGVKRFDLGQDIATSRRLPLFHFNTRRIRWNPGADRRLQDVGWSLLLEVEVALDRNCADVSALK